MLGSIKRKRERLDKYCHGSGRKELTLSGPGRAG